MPRQISGSRMTREKIKSFVNGKKPGGSEALLMSASLLVKFLSISYHKKPFREPNACDLRLLKRFCPRRRGAALKTVAAMARRKRRLAPQRNHTDSVITFYNRDTEKARDKMGNEMKKFRQISTKAHRTGCRRKTREHALPRVGAKRRSTSF